MPNKPYRTDEQMEKAEKERKRRENLKKREARNSLADQIFRAVVVAVEKERKTNFSKEEMVGLVAGQRIVSPLEWVAWNVAFTVAVRKIRSYFWNDGYEGDENRAFNYVDGRYWLIDVDDELRSNIMYDSYHKKMKGIAKHQKQLKESVYAKILEFDEGSRKSLIAQLRQQGLLTNGG